MNHKLRALAVHLPQFHPIPENDRWWGKGFTEWTNVTRSLPKYEGHYQPHLPADMGFYDLRLNESLIAQAELAADHGIHGFCFYHYWFTGKKLLERPTEQMLALGTPDFPFCFCWANENWTRNWDGLNNHVLMEQHYSAEDDKEHIQYLAQFFNDKRYIRVDDKPVLLVYRTEIIPDIKKTAERLRSEAQKLGFKDLYLINVESFKKGVDPAEIGFDAAFDFQPNWKNFPSTKKATTWEVLKHKLGIEQSALIDNNVFEYAEFVDKQIASNTDQQYKIYPGVTPMWDNSARRKTEATIFQNSTPELYGKWLEHVVSNFKPYSSDENFIFINAWNEWAEGNHLEPCQKWGKAYLEVTKTILNS